LSITSHVRVLLREFNSQRKKGPPTNEVKNPVPVQANIRIAMLHSYDMQLGQSVNLE
jgi:hypothetical protein